MGCIRRLSRSRWRHDSRRQAFLLISSLLPYIRRRHKPLHPSPIARHRPAGMRVVQHFQQLAFQTRQLIRRTGTVRRHSNDCCTHLTTQPRFASRHCLRHTLRSVVNSIIALVVEWIGDGG